MAIFTTNNQYIGKHLLLVSGAHNEDYQGFFYTVPREAGIVLSVADKPGHWSEDAAKRGLLHSFHPVNLDLPREQLTDKLVELVSSSNVNFSGIITFTDQYLVAVAAAAQRLNMPTNGPGAYKLAHDKETVRKKCNSTVNSYRIKSVEDLPQAAQSVSFPAVLKPVHGTDSLAVRFVPSCDDLEKVYQEISGKLPALTTIIGSTSDLLLEEYITGSEHKIDLIIQNKKTLFASLCDSKCSNLPWFQEAGMTYPSKVGLDCHDKLIQYAINVCEVLGMDNGVMHVELKLSGNTPKLIELNARMGCAYVWHGVKTAWGVDLLLNSYKLALGVQLSLPNRGSLDFRTHPQKVYVVSKFLSAPCTGYVQSNEYLQRFKEDKRVLFVNSMAQVGQKVYGPEDDRPSYLALLLFTGSTSREETVRYAETSIQNVHLSQIISKQLPAEIVI